MSINWVMLSEDKQSFTPLPGEQHLYTSPARTALSVESSNRYPGREPFSLQSGAGTVHLTNRRMIYLPAKPTPNLESFAAPILNLYDAHVTAPFFGPNVWTAIAHPTPGGGIPPQVPALELKMTFKDGGAFDFHSTYERIKERLQQAVDVARESGQLVDRSTETGRGGLQGVDLNTVHLDELPTYGDATSGRGGRGVTAEAASPPPLIDLESPTASSSAEAREVPPSAPPGYEEVQRESVADLLERRLHQG